MPTIPYKTLIDESGNSFYPMCGESSFSNPVPVSKGGTGAGNVTDAIANLGVCAFPTFITDPNSGTTTSEVLKNYTVVGNGFIIAAASVYSDSTNSYGSAYATIQLNGTALVRDCARIESSAATPVGAGATVGFLVSDGDTVGMHTTCTKGGTKYITRCFLCFGCTVVANT